MRSRSTISGETFRTAQAADVDSIVHVLRTSRLHFLPYAPPAHSEAEDLAWVSSVLLIEDVVTLARIDAQVVGVLAIRQTRDAGWIDQFYLLPGFTGGGLGGRLLQTALTALEGPVRLYTFQQNVRARAFYEAHGFVPIAFGDGSGNEEGCPDVLYERSSVPV